MCELTHHLQYAFYTARLGSAAAADSCDLSNSFATPVLARTTHNLSHIVERQLVVTQAAAIVTISVTYAVIIVQTVLVHFILVLFGVAA